MGLTPVAGSIVAPGIVSLSVNPGKNERKKGSEEQIIVFKKKKKKNPRRPEKLYKDK